MSVEEKTLLVNDKWRRFRNNKDRMDKLLIPAFEEAGLTRECEKFMFCGSVVATQDCKQCDTKHFKGFKRCTSRWCPNCSYVKRLIWLKRLLPELEKERTKGNKIIKLNLTVQDGTNLQSKIDEMEKAWRNLYHGRGGREMWKNRIVGGIRSLEVKIGSNSGQWHPHYHLILIVKPEFNKDIAWLLPRWKQLLNPECGKCNEMKEWSKAITDGQADPRPLCYMCPENRGSAWIKGVQEDWKEVLEAVKYIIKPDEEVFQKENLLEAYITLKNKRQINTIGSIRGIAKRVQQDEKEQKENLTQLEEFVCQVCGYSQAELRLQQYYNIKDKFVVDLKKGSENI